MIRSLRRLGGAPLIAFALVWSAVGVHTSCRQALALGLDVSASVDSGEYRLQLDGLASALLSEDVSELILGMPFAPIRLYVFEWSGPKVQRTILPWREISDRSTLEAAAVQIAAHQRDPLGDSVDHSTAIRPALDHARAAILEQAQCWKRTVDISGDGKNNTGGDPRGAHPALAQATITVNGLVIGVDAQRGGDTRQIEIGELSS